ncbi:MAG: histidine kinase N-terminal 7TM domain-containing protein [Geobacteraceae bacterium]|nr:histidine kinase N-terminal 7TM domain-containing protein [Geobacteraceae bacterium]
MLLITLLTVSAAGMFLLALFGWKRRQLVPAAKVFSALMLTVALYCAGYAIQFSCESTSCMLIAFRVKFLGISFLPAFWLLLVFYSCDMASRIPRSLMIVLFVIPVLTFAIVFSDISLSSQSQLLTDTATGSFPRLVFTNDHWFKFHILYFFLAILAGNAFFLSMVLRSARHVKVQATAMFLGSLLPWGALIAYLAGMVTSGFDPFPLSLTVSGLLFAFGLFRYRLVNLAPMVRSTLVENLKDGVLVFNQDGRLLDLNRSAFPLLAMPQQKAIGALREQVLSDHPVLLEAINAGGGLVDEREPEHYSGRLAAQVTVTPIRGRWRSNAGSLVLIHDISGLKKVESDLRDSEEKFRLLFDAAPDPILLMDDSCRFIDCNSAALRIFGMASRGNVLHRNLTYFSPEYQPDGELSSDKEAGVVGLAFAEGTALSEWAFRHRDGSLVIADLSIAIISIKGVKVQLIHLRDITEKKHVEQKLREISLMDELTGLHNRRGFMTLALQQIKIADRLAQGMTLLYADLDDLKVINDTYGHLAGDQALIDAATVLRTSLRASDILARLGGDEFVGLILESGGETELAVKARVQENLNAHNLHGVRLYRLSFSIGTARYDITHPCSVEELLEGADREMYRNKLEKKAMQSL